MFGQHGNGTVHEIHACGAFLGFLVDDASLCDIVGNVGDMHAHFIQAVVQFFERESIVKVLGIGRVDGAGPCLAEVFALGHVLRGDFSGEFLRGILHGFRVFIGQSVLREDGVHLHIVVAALAQHVGHLAHEVTMLGVGPVGYLHESFLAVLASLELVLGNEHVVHQVVVLRHQERDVLAHAQLAHKGVLGTLQDGDDLCLLDVFLPSGHERHPHPVSGECRHRVAFGHEHWLVVAIGNERVLAVRLADKPAFLHLPFRVERVGAVGFFRQEVVPSHLFHDIDGQHLQRMSVEAQRAEDLFERDGFPGLR